MDQGNASRVRTELAVAGEIRRFARNCARGSGGTTVAHATLGVRRRDSCGGMPRSGRRTSKAVPSTVVTTSPVF
ncbi:MAG: hypothetical protein QM681_23760, partial [Novosphingobium sp.]